MRKWMRDKLKRRKKSEEAAAGQPAPLQPAYFEEQQAKGEAAEALSENPRAGRDTPPEPEQREETGGAETGTPAEVTQAGSESASGRAASDSRRPRRRRRGGRGRRRSGAATAIVAQPTEEPAAKIETVPSGDAAEETGIVRATAPAAELASRPSKGVVVLAIGLPGSGKSSWFKRHNLNPLSSDMIRAILFDDPTEQRFQDLVFSNLRSMLRARLVARRPLNYVDATNLTPHDRHSWIKLARDFGYEVQAVYFDVPLEVCLERNQRRQRMVSEDVMRRMAAKLKPPSFSEGFSKITVVRVKSKS